MKKKLEIYFCEHCKKVFNSVDKLLFVEEKEVRGFCQEACIEKFYFPLIDYFNNFEKNIRAELKVQDEDAVAALNQVGELDQYLLNPSEVWVVSSQLGDQFFTYIKNVEIKNQMYYLITITLTYQKKPSFVFLMTATQSQEVVKRFRQGEPVENISQYQQQVSRDHKNKDLFMGAADLDQLEPSIREFLESKKSTFLSWILKNHSLDDIEIESYVNYMHFIRTTLEDPDEIYRWTDDEGDTMLTYIKGGEQEGICFYYLVICSHQQQDNGHNMALPILTFPTRNSAIYNNFKKGDRISGNLKNLN
ncbi:MAG: hypothetical protein A2202_05265 [Bdellovibrionales bacterium RIFOXYA1_FULL_36_14]|nr:MAG: hypothetical protein A2202_05265 [Bdellovibrionales bacterium RIFOXYA1_FULL_36_14]